MTLAEKSNVTYGHTGPCVGQTGAVPRLGISELCFADAPDGIRGQEFVSAFPAGIHLGATFDRQMMYAYGKALGDEYRGKGIHVALGPFIGPIGRIARGGRNWEGLGADPYLAGIGGGEITRGIQNAGVISTPKVCAQNGGLGCSLIIRAALAPQRAGVPTTRGFHGRGYVIERR
jgi:beta-glucosidase